MLTLFVLPIIYLIVVILQTNSYVCRRDYVVHVTADQSSWFYNSPSNITVYKATNAKPPKLNNWK